MNLHGLISLKNRAQKLIGRRGSALLFFAYLEFVFCWFLFTAPPQLTQTPSYKFIASIFPLWGWAIAWGVAGVACTISAVRKKDTIGFVAAMAILMGWSAVQFSGEILGKIPFGYVSASIFFALAVLVRIISGWSEEEVVGGQ